MPRYYDRDRRPEEGWASGSRATRRSGWEPVRMTGDDHDWDDDWDESEGDERQYPGRGYSDETMAAERGTAWGSGDSRWGRGLRRAVSWGRGREEGRERWPGSGREQASSDAYAYQQGRRGPQRPGSRWDSDDSRWASGPYAGVGPKGYQRSDDRIREDVCELLTRHGQLDASNIEVDVRDGEVTLTGLVDSRWAKREAEDVADEASGVRDVHNQLRVSGDRRGQDRMVGTATDASARAATASNVGATATGMAGSTTQRVDVREGMTVVASDGDTVGGVKELRGSDFLLDRPMQRDVYVPLSLVQRVDGNVLYLSAAGYDLDNMNLEQPSLTGDEGDTETTR